MSSSSRSTTALLASLLIASVAAHGQTSITCGPGLTCTPSPITGTGSVAIAGPLAVSNGGTGSASFTTGSIPFSSGGVLSQNNANLIWDNLRLRLRTYLEDRGGQVFNAQAYGATGNGSTDDTAAIQAAITAAGAGIVYLPAGQYKVSSALSLSASGASLLGAGVGATRLVTNSATSDVIRMGLSGSYRVPGSRVGDLSIGASVTRTAGAAIRVYPGEQFTIDNIRIGPMGGDGIVANAVGGVSPAIIYASRIDAEITGAFSAVLVDGGGEFHLSHSWLRGPVFWDGTVTGSVGINVLEGGVFVNDVEAVQFERGIYLHPAAGKLVAWSTFRNVLADQNALHGFHLAGSGNIWGISLIDCWAGTNAVASPHTSINGTGFKLEKGDGIIVSNVRSINNGGHGIDVLSGVTNLSILGGFVTGNSVASYGNAQGIAIEANVQRFRIQGVRTGSAAGQPVQQGWGIFIVAGSDNYIVTGNDTAGNVTGGINNVPGTSATRIVASNL